MQSKIKNAKIKSVSIFYGDHGILTSFVDLDYGGSGQGLGGYDLGANFDTKPEKATVHLGAWVGGILRTLEVDRWEKLPGVACRIKASHNKVEAIGHLLKDRWFYPTEVFERIEAAQPKNSRT